MTNLDNPIWHSLQTRHKALAQGNGRAQRYLPQVTPFVGVSEPSEEAAGDLKRIVAPGEQVGILSIMPNLEDGWTLVKEIEIHQYVWPAELEALEEPAMARLSEEHIPAMVELTALVYPAYFRSETARLGDYFGFLEEGKLCAMGGIRMSMEGHQELSAICTHPAHRGRGHAAQITRHLVNQVQSQGDIPFLHTESYNSGAKSLYEKLGFKLRTALPFKIIQRI